ncbi:hypothetical protein [Dactylosporangium darangshiense]|uniref:hypothetical protein n=1 Tax=Dactylosporangium darangshiense TaxID=579108 RepID=UPI003643EA9F
MKRAILVVTVALAMMPVCGAGPAAAARPAEPAQRLVQAIVVLTAQVDPSTVKAPNRRQRGATLERTLRATADTAQRASSSCCASGRRRDSSPRSIHCGSSTASA